MYITYLVVKELITVSSGEEDENSPFSSTTAKKRKLGPMMWAKMKEIFGSYRLLGVYFNIHHLFV